MTNSFQLQLFPVHKSQLLIQSLLHRLSPPNYQFPFHIYSRCRQFMKKKGLAPQRPALRFYGGKLKTGAGRRPSHRFKKRYFSCYEVLLPYFAYLNVFKIKLYYFLRRFSLCGHQVGPPLAHSHAMAKSFPLQNQVATLDGSTVNKH